MKKYLIGLFFVSFFFIGCSGKKVATHSNNNQSKDKISGSYTAYGITANVDAKNKSKAVITNLKIEFNNGKYSVSYCIDDSLNTTSNCDMIKQNATGTYTIEGDTLHLNLGKSSTIDLQTNQIVTSDNDTNRICKIIEDNQIIIDCRGSGGWIYFSSHIDDKYYKKNECSEFDGKTYEGEAKYSGYYLRNGTWVDSPGVVNIKISFKNGELTDYQGNMFKNTNCEKINDSNYKIGIREATYNKANDSFFVKIEQVDGINYGTVELINSAKKKKLIQLPDIIVTPVCPTEDKCYFKSNITLNEMKTFAKKNKIKLKIYYTSDSSYKSNSVTSYCDLENVNKSNDIYCTWTSTPYKVYEGDTIGIEVTK